jgi:hypothetical protein
MDQKVKNLMRRFDSAASIAQLWRPHLDTAYKYIMPNRNSFYYSTPAQQKDTEVYDTTAVMAARSFASKLHATLTPPFIQWADLTAGSEIRESEREEANLLLQEITKVLFKFIHASNFDLAINENYMDLTIGTATLKIDEGTDDNPFIFTATPVSEMAFEEDAYGVLDNCYREFTIKGYEITQLWPDARLPHDLADAIAKDDTKEVKLREMTVVKYIGDYKEYNYYVIEPEKGSIIYENTEPSSCWIPFRWSKLSGDTFGRGPGIEVLKTIKTLNKVVEFELKGAALAIAPPFISNNNSELNVNNFSIRPNALIQVNTPMPGIKALEQLMVNPNIQFGQLLAGDFRQQINKAFYTDPLGPIDAPAKTATEILQRQQQLMEEIGPAFGRLQTEFLRRVIDRCIYILSKKGLIPSMRVDGNLITIQYRSPLARSQAQSEVINFQQMYQVLAGIVGPELALLGINADELPEWLSERFGVDLNLIKSAMDLQMLQQQIMQLAQQQQVQQLPTPQAA